MQDTDDWLEIVLCADTPDIAESLETALWQTGALSVTLTPQKEDVILLESNPGDMPQWQQAYVTGLYAQGTDAREIIGFLKLLLSVQKLPLKQLQSLSDREWETEWQQYFEPISFGKAHSLWVCPSSQTIPASAPSGCDVIYLDPGLAFGTGTHPTTAMVLTWLANQNLADNIVVDYGCGSGILGIASLKRGARFCVLNDIDEKALIATRDNLEKNNITERFAVCFPEDTAKELIAHTSSVVADVVIANILLEPLINLRDELCALCQLNGTILLTGILHQQVDSVLTHYDNMLYDINIERSDDWSMIMARKS